MLSTENLQPDLPCELKSKDCICVSEQCQFQAVDLSSIEEKIPLSNFSIRNYVSSKRQKDISTNWPFSEKTLQLCLKYNVKDVLPPFQSLDSVKNSSLLNPEHNVSPRLVVDTKNSWSSTSGKDKEFKSTTTSQSCSKLSRDILKPVKKCKLIVKLGTTAGPKVTEDLLEMTMVSKLCPVCKVFSSSSNTTLNAHIDRCLSVESTSKCTTDSKSIKHRIKPRKTRLMADIYEAALQCTLEDLDKRNGTNWTSNLAFTAQGNEACSGEKNVMCSTINTEENENKNEDSAVYIDSNGTKVRLLSKFNDPPSSKTAKDDNGPKKLVKTDKVGKFLCKEKKNYLVNDHSASKPPPKVDNFKQQELSTEAHTKEELKRALRTYDQMTSNDKGMIKQWVSSKRTCLRKKMSLEHQEKAMKILGLKSNIVSVGKLMNGSKNPIPSISSDENIFLCKRKHNLSCSSDDELKEQPFPRKTAGLFPSNVKKLRTVGPSVLERIADPPKGTKNQVSSHINKKTCMDVVSDTPCISLSKPHERLNSSIDKEFTSTKRSSLDNVIISSGGKKFSSLRKNMLSVNDVPIHKSKKAGRKFSDFTKPSMNCALRSDEEAVGLTFAEPSNLVEMPSKPKQGFGESLVNRSYDSKIQKTREQFMSNGQKEDVASVGSYSSRLDYHGNGNSAKTLVCEPSRVADEEALATFSKSVSSQFPTAADPSDNECVSQQFVRVNEEQCSPELLLSGDQENLSEAGNYLISHKNTDLLGEMGNGNYIVEVDLIPIPGPPGSFLPSLGRMGSEERQGSSSLTSYKIQSSENEHELVNMHSSDSPTSNFVAAKSGSVSFVNVSYVQNESQCGDADNRMDPFVERTLKFDESISNLTFHEKADLRLKNEQLYCCSRKEGVSQNGPLNYQQSQLSVRFVPEPVSVNSEATFHAGGDCESPNPLNPNPVLRLMGKNLMVVNKAENLPLDNGGNLHNRHRLFPHTSSPSVFDTVQMTIPARVFNSSPPHGSKVPSISSTAQPATGPHRPTAPKLSYGDSYGRKNSDVIFIDNSPANELCLDKRFVVNMEHGRSSSQVASGYDPYHVHHSYSYRGQGYPHCSGSRVQNTNLVEWICASESSSILHPNPLTALSTSTTNTTITGRHLNLGCIFLL